MATVKDLLSAEIGAKTGGFTLTIKTVKKRWQADGQWIHQVVLTDTTGDILTDIVKPSNAPFFRANDLYIIVCEIQASADGKKLVVHEWKQETFSEPPERMDWAASDGQEIVAGKIRHGLVCAAVQSKQIEIVNEDDLRQWVNFILTGK